MNRPGNHFQTHEKQEGDSVVASMDLLRGNCT